MKDYLVRGLVNSKNCRVFACQTTNLLEKARQEHDLWPTASAALGRMMSATLMMAAMNKNNEKMTVTINGGGPIGTMMAVTRGDGHIKGFVGDPHVHYTYNDTGHLAVGVAVGTQGTLQVIRDMGLKEPFCGTVPLQTGEIGDDFSYYFMASEQTPSVVSVGVLVDETNEILSSGGFIIQLLPEATEEDISYIEEKIKDFPAVSSLIHEGKTPEEILKMIFDDVEITDRQDLFFTCDCSREKMINALSTIGKQELQSMIDEDHGCEITCQFCNTKYQFSEEELQKAANLPAMIYYGVNSDEAILMRMNNVPRSVAAEMGVEYKKDFDNVYKQSSYEIRQWIEGLSSDKWNAFAENKRGMSGSDYRAIWKVLNNES